LEGDNISSNSTGNSILTTFQQQQQEQYDIPPLMYSQNDQALAQELEKQVKKQDLTSVCRSILSSLPCYLIQASPFFLSVLTPLFGFQIHSIFFFFW